MEQVEVVRVVNLRGKTKKGHVHELNSEKTIQGIYDTGFFLNNLVNNNAPVTLTLALYLATTLRQVSFVWRTL